MASYKAVTLYVAVIFALYQHSSASILKKTGGSDPFKSILEPVIGIFKGKLGGPCESCQPHSSTSEEPHTTEKPTTTTQKSTTTTESPDDPDDECDEEPTKTTEKQTTTTEKTTTTTNKPHGSDCNCHQGKKSGKDLFDFLLI